jgi:hypothetical protein
MNSTTHHVRLPAVRIGMLLLLLANPANAGWFSRGPDPKVEAANRALERAAEIAAEAATIQAEQHHQILDAVTALSNERTHMAEQLSVLGQLAAKDSAWAAALGSLGPSLVALAVLALGCAAIWMVTRSGDRDSDLAAMLVEEVCGGSGGLIAGTKQPRLEEHSQTLRVLEGPDEIDGAVRTVAHSRLLSQFDHESQDQEGDFPF